MFEDSRNYLEKKGFPEGDLRNLPTSKKRFEDGANFRIEVPVNTLPATRKVFEESNKLGYTINRVDATLGIFRHPDDEIRGFVALAEQNGAELFMSVGPRAIYDTGAQVHTGSRWSGAPAFRLRGLEQVLRGVEDIKRGVELGARGFLVYDEGFLWLVNEMRKDGVLPEEVKFKCSAHMACCNPISARVLESLGADSINPTRDLELPMIAAIRQSIDIALDLHADNPQASGGFVRTYEAPEMVRIAAPVYIKSGNVAVVQHAYPTTIEDAVRIAKQASMTAQFIRKYYPEAVQSEKGAGMAITHS